MTSHTISEMIFTPIAVGDPPLLNCVGVHASWALRIVLELKTEGGVVGVSEIPGNIDTLFAIDRLADVILGHDVFQLNALLANIRRELEGSDRAPDERGTTPWDQRIAVHLFSALEVACLDIIGKELNRSVCDLLGGKMRERVPFAAYLFYKYRGAGGELEYEVDENAGGWERYRQAEAVETEDIIAQADEMCKSFGFKSIKLKGGFFDPEKEVNDTIALAEAFGPEVPLRFDPNAVWSLETGIKWGKKLEGYLEYLEDPVRGQKNMSLLKKEVNIPLATNMCTTSFDDIPSSIALQSEDVILSDHHFWGGLRASMELYKICQTFGRGLSMHSNSHLGISMAAMVHLGAALPTMEYEFDTHYPWQNEDVIVGGKLKIEEGFVEVPKGPGLGVEIDQRQLKKLHRNYVECGLFKRDDEAEMKKIDPTWEFLETRY